MRPRFFFRTLNLLLLFIVLADGNGNAGTRRNIWDAELVKDSDFIVMAHLKDNHFQTVKHNESSSYEVTEYTTTLVATKILKGDISPGELSIIIHHGLVPVVLKKSIHGGTGFNPKPADE